MLLTQLIALAHDSPSARLFLQNHNVLRAAPPICGTTACNRLMTEIKRAGSSDGVMYRCPVHKGNTQSIRQNSFLANSHLKLEQFTLLLYLWCQETSNKAAMSMLGLSSATVVDWYNLFREICSQYLIRHRQQIGGPGVIVEIDESLVAKRKCHVGHIVPERWVFGGVNAATNIGFLVFVENRSAEVLLPLIEQFIAPGSIIHSDGWAAYNGIPAIPVIPPYVHQVVNHNQNFVNPQNGATTNHVECFWKNAKRRLKTMAGTSTVMLPSHLDEFMWRQLRGRSGAEAFANIMDDISEQYPF